MNKDTNRLKNSFSYHDKAEQYERKNRIEIEKQIVQSRRLLPKENLRRNQSINKCAHLKKPYQVLNNGRSLKKDQNKREATNLKKIKNFIELCYKRIQNKQSKILNSLLDQPYNKVKIDKVLDQKEKNLSTHDTEEWINECIYKELNGVI
ncbi:43716_t:CDS:2, partial [Gigaspora margarita]